VQSLWTAVNEGGAWLKDVPRYVRTVIDTRAWEEREVDGRIVRHKRFIDFITGKPRSGCGWQPEKVEALIKDHPDVLALWREAVTEQPGRLPKNSDNVTHFEDDGRGNSKSYTLSRLKRERPDLFRRVCDREMSAYRAAIEAGFRKQPTPFEQVAKFLGRQGSNNTQRILPRIARERPDVLDRYEKGEFKRLAKSISYRR
jgi:hypothetical protein